jgi:hypothetical protein
MQQPFYRSLFCIIREGIRYNYPASTGRRIKTKNGGNGKLPVQEILNYYSEFNTKK